MLINSSTFDDLPHCKTLSQEDSKALRANKLPKSKPKITATNKISGK